MPNSPTTTQATYECVELDSVGQCLTWQIVEQNEVSPPLNDAEQNQLLLAVLSVMVLVWLFKMLKRAISYYVGFVLTKSNFKKIDSPLKKNNFQTLGIGQTPTLHSSKNIIYRFKGSSNNLNQLIESSINDNFPWCVDFNGSLKVEELLSVSNKFFISYKNLNFPYI